MARILTEKAFLKEGGFLRSTVPEDKRGSLIATFGPNVLTFCLPLLLLRHYLLHFQVSGLL